jgi:hypothetical protein
MSRARREAEISPRLVRYINDILVLKREVLKNMAEVAEDYQEIVRRNIRETIEDMGIKEVIEAVGMDHVIEAVGVDYVIEAVGIDATKAALARVEKQKKKSKKQKPAAKGT